MLDRAAPLRAAVVGAGFGGTLSIDALTASPDYELVAVADSAPASLERIRARFPDLALFGSLGELLPTARPDVVCISTYAPSHEPLVELAIAEGVRGLLVEKPLGDTVASGQRILELTRAARLPFVVPHGLMTHPAALDILRRVGAGELGALQLVEVESARWDIINAGIHWIQFFLSLAAPGKAVTVLTAADVTARTYRDGMQVESDSITIVTLDTGVKLVLQTGDYIPLVRAGTDCVMRIIGTDGFIEYGAWDDHYTLVVGGQPKQEVHPDPLPTSGHRSHLERLAELVREGAVDERIPLTSLAALEIVEAAYLSHRSRSQITLPLGVDRPRPTVLEGDWDPGTPYRGAGGGRNGREL